MTLKEEVCYSINDDRRSRRFMSEIGASVTSDERMNEVKHLFQARHGYDEYKEADRLRSQHEDEQEDENLLIIDHLQTADT